MIQVHCNKAANACEGSIEDNSTGLLRKYDFRARETNRLGTANLTLRAVALINIGKSVASNSMKVLVLM